MGKLVVYVGYRVGSPMDVSDDLQEEALDLEYERRIWHMDDPQLESDDVAEVGVWKEKRGYKKRMKAVTDHKHSR